MSNHKSYKLLLTNLLKAFQKSNDLNKLMKVIKIILVHYKIRIYTMKTEDDEQIEVLTYKKNKSFKNIWYEDLYFEEDSELKEHLKLNTWYYDISERMFYFNYDSKEEQWKNGGNLLSLLRHLKIKKLDMDLLERLNFEVL